MASKNFKNPFFNFTAYEAVIRSLSAESGETAAKKEKFFQKWLEDCHEYVKCVDMTETQIRLAYARIDDTWELQDRIQRIDAGRRAAHEAAIAAASALNRMAAAYGCDPLFTGRLEDRLQVADFCLDVSVDLFEKRRI